MNEEIKKLILAKIDALHEKDNLRGIQQNRERLLNDLLTKRHYESRNGKVTNKDGVPQNITQDVELLVDASPYIGIRADVKSSKYVSPFKNPNEETRKKIAQETEQVLLKLSSLNKIIAKDKDNYERAIWLIAKNFVWEMDEEGEVRFAKLNDNGLTSEARFTFDEIKPDHLIDRFRTRHSQQLREAELRQIAQSIVGEIPKGVRKGADTVVKQEGQDAPPRDPIQATIADIRKNEILCSFQPKRIPHIPMSTILNETMRRECAIRDLGPLDAIRQNMSSQTYRDLDGIAKREYERLQDTTPIMKQIQAIQPAAAATYEDLSYDL